eukprot:g4145.t1
MAYMRTMMINVSEMNTFFNEIWSKYDTNSRGYIEATETRLMIQDFSGAKELQKEEVHSFLVRIDKDGNGKIDKKELVHFIVDGIAMEEEEKIEYASRGKFQKHMIDFFNGIKKAKDIFLSIKGKKGLEKYLNKLRSK